MNYPILGNPWHFYCDESGDRNPKAKDNCLCFAIVGMPGYKDEKVKSEDINIRNTKTSKPFFKKLIDTLKYCQAITTIAYFDLSDSQTINRITARHSIGKTESNLPLREHASISNYVWEIAYGLSLFNAICNVCNERNRVNNVFVKYHKFPLKERERAILDNYKQWLVDHIKNINTSLRDFAKYDYWKAENIHVSSISEASDDLVQIQLAHYAAKLFRKFYKQKTIIQFEGNFKKGSIYTKDLTHQFRDWDLTDRKT
jgi:hypothetical protein